MTTMSNQVLTDKGEKYLIINKVAHKMTPYNGRKTDVYGNNRACNCPDLMSVARFCVCIARVWCEKHGGPRCVGGHD